jgi:hypothetical protein
MELTRSVVESYADEYRAEEPLYAVESEQVETLPDAFARGDFGRRDAEWVVRWFFRRFFGDIPDAHRRKREDQFENNDFGAVKRAIVDAAAADTRTAIGRLAELDGVDVPVASAFLFFVDPESSVVIGEREWTALRIAGQLSEPYPETPAIDDYETYLAICRALIDRLDCDGWTLYMALWRLWKDEHESA